jgi:hypothetical protein
MLEEEDMARINVYHVNQLTGAKAIEGYFNPETAVRYEQAREWDGENMVGVITRSQWIDEYLYRTKRGRWVLHHDATRYHDGPDTYRFVSDTYARNWLLRSEINDDAIAEYFSPVADERGPSHLQTGPPVMLRLGELLPQVDEAAAASGLTRGEMVRRLIAAGLDG